MSALMRVGPEEHAHQSWQRNNYPINKQEEKSQPGFGWNVVFLTLAAGIGGFLFGYDTGVISGAVPYMEDDILAPYAEDMVLMHKKQEWIVSSALLGAVLACSISGFISDKYGRKTTLMIGDMCFVVGSLFQAGSQSLNSVVVGRILVGVGIGTASVIVPVYIGECSPAQHRGTLVTINVLMITIGQFSSYLMNYLLASVPGTWRWMVGVAALPALLQMVIFPFLPESPKWLMSKGQHASAIKAAGFLRIEQEKDVGSSQHMAWELFFSPEVKYELRIGVGLQILQQLCGINTVMYYTPIILQMAGYANRQQVLLLSLLPAAVNSVGVFIGMQLVERFGRRRLLITSLASVSMSLFLLGIAFRGVPLNQSASCNSGADPSTFLQDVSTDPGKDLQHQSSRAATQENCSSSGDGHILLFILLYLIAFSPGLGPVPWAVNAEIYPLAIRSIGNGIASTANWTANFVLSQVFLSAVDWIGPQGFFCSLSTIAAAGGFIVYSYLPETKGLSLSEIQTLFSAIVSSPKTDNQPLSASVFSP